MKIKQDFKFKTGTSVKSNTKTLAVCAQCVAGVGQAVEDGMMKERDEFLSHTGHRKLLNRTNS